MSKIYQAKMIITMDASHPFATHVAVRKDTIVGLGGEEIVDLFPGYRLDKRFAKYTIIPGFVEGHAHLLAGQDGLAPYVGYFDRPSPEGVTLKGLKSFDEIVTYLKKCEKGMKDGVPLMAIGFDPIYFDGKRVDRYDLDRVSTDRMVFLYHISGHVITANSKGIEALPQDKVSKLKEFVKDDKGVPNGEIRELAAMSLVFQLLGAEFAKFTDLSVIFPRYMELARMAGVTTITEMGVDINLDDKATIEKVVKHTKNSPVRLVPMYFAPTSNKKMQDIPKYVEGLKKYNTDKLKFGLVKAMADGSIQGYTARLKKPYVNGVKNGVWNMKPADLAALTLACTKEKISLNCHCNGDEASEVFIKAVEKAIAKYKWSDNRHTIQHGQMVYAKQFEKMKKLGMGANLFTNHIYYWGDIHVKKTIGKVRAERMDGAGTALALGVPFSLHCDASVTPIAPLFNMWSAVNRVTVSGKVLGADERISTYDALYAMTMGTAYLLRLENEIGSVTIGKKADFAVLGKDPYTVEPSEIKDIKVVTTVLGGEVTNSKM